MSTTIGNVSQYTIDTLLHWNKTDAIHKLRAKDELIGLIPKLRLHKPFDVVPLENVDEIELMFYAKDQSIIKNYHIKCDDRQLYHINCYSNKKVYE